MNTILVPLFLFAGAAGAWFGLVDNIKLSFLGGLIAWVIGLTLTFRGSLALPKWQVPAAMAARLRAAINVLALLILLALGAAGIWFGLVDDVKLAFLGGLASWAAGIYVTFNGGVGSLLPSRSGAAITLGPRAESLRSALTVTGVVCSLFLGAAGVWFGLVDDIKLAMLGGIIVWVGAVQAVFRGKAAF